MTNPKEQLAELSIDTLSGIKLDKAALKEADFMNVLVFYRGLHCPICKTYLEELNEFVEDFHEEGINVTAISMDSEARARKSRQDWKIDNLEIGYGMSEEKARELGLYISNSVKESEPESFSEPAVFVVKPDRTVYSVSIQSMPFARPEIEAMLKGLKFIKEKEYPARGAA